MSATDKPVSLWDDTSTETIRVRKDDLNNRVDVAIVGAGYTGLSAAIHSAEKGMSCHVIEAEHVGYGGSGRNTGLVNAAAWLPPQDVIKQLGEKAGKKFVDILDFKRGIDNYVFRDFWSTRVFSLSKNIGKFLLKLEQYLFPCIDGHILFLFEIKTSYIIHSCCVIFMLMSKKDGV